MTQDAAGGCFDLLPLPLRPRGGPEGGRSCAACTTAEEPKREPGALSVKRVLLLSRLVLNGQVPPVPSLPSGWDYRCALPHPALTLEDTVSPLHWTVGKCVLFQREHGLCRPKLVTLPRNSRTKAACSTLR